MTSLLEIHKKTRVIKGKLKSKKYQITIFIGLYNAEKYLDSIFSQINKQVNQEFHLIVADNNSSDNTWRNIQDWAEYFEGRITLVKNKVNLGGTGNLIINLDLIKTDWFCTFHQDDYYKKNHIEYLLKNINFSDSKLAAVTPDMGSMDNDGKKFARRVRAAWFIKNDDQIEAFISNLFVHNVYWPSTAFNLSIFKKATKNSLWHSSTFPDTEILLRMIAYGKIKRINKETMVYRENDTSESRSINPVENLYGVFNALVRVFESTEFSLISRKVDQKKRSDFFKYICEGIFFRLENDQMAGILIFIVSEKLIEIWGYDNTSNLSTLIKIYENLNSAHTVSILRNILLMKSDLNNKLNLDKDRNLIKLFNSKFEPKLKPTMKFTSMDKLYRKIGKYIPYLIAKRVLGRAYILKIKFTKNHPWRFYNFRHK
jgi:glycosyltransferase involved in cell wall biosynthesis